MKHLLRGLLVAGFLAFTPAAYAQDFVAAPIEYSERVPDENAEASVLYQRTLDWTENRFTYKPKEVIRTDATKGEIRVSGTVKVKTASNSGQMQERPVVFEFVFRTLPTGYEYSVGYFRVIPDAKNPTTTVPFEEFVSQLAKERNNERTHNDRRVTAQATSLASEIAMSFRSYMNSRPAAGAIE
ncbi:DUF4468 domain-containing protein [Hymenobacter sp. BT186]|uniref:DUF4468 domain-containing protein n=1 Tax=Hymenobacter telluris TaxID=2816474 RepID=A0A939EUF0_9BACT|nr:DUF4468 domain-containing protein [Hymenobacter telluris]MBO0356885.1 DUF4468 domain-containing protein [Hymenobacter telluris]MBW3372912.1 DUF4468 domain-containing protein [Hymenobacter norwichensis]